jgi:hypothetical protein
MVGRGGWCPHCSLAPAQSYLILPPRGSMWRNTDAPSSCVCLVVSLLGVAVAIPARRLIFGTVMGCGSFGGGLFAIVASLMRLNKRDLYPIRLRSHTPLPTSAEIIPPQEGVGAESTAAALAAETIRQPQTC